MIILRWLAYALILTTAIEFAAYFLFMRENPAGLLLSSLVINGLTNPLLNYIYLFEVHDLLLLEILAVLVESLLIMAFLGLGYLRALILSASANIASALAGSLIMPAILRFQP